MDNTNKKGLETGHAAQSEALFDALLSTGDKDLIYYEKPDNLTKDKNVKGGGSGSDVGEL